MKLIMFSVVVFAASGPLPWCFLFLLILTQFFSLFLFM